MTNDDNLLDRMRAPVLEMRRRVAEQAELPFDAANAEGLRLATVAAAAELQSNRMEARQHAYLDELVAKEMEADATLKRTPAEAKVKAGEQYIGYRERKAEFGAVAEEARALSRYFFNRARMLAHTETGE